MTLARWLLVCAGMAIAVAAMEANTWNDIYLGAGGDLAHDAADTVQSSHIYQTLDHDLHQVWRGGESSSNPLTESEPHLSVPPSYIANSGGMSQVTARNAHEAASIYERRVILEHVETFLNAKTGLLLGMYTYPAQIETDDYLYSALAAQHLAQRMDHLYHLEEDLYLTRPGQKSELLNLLMPLLSDEPIWKTILVWKRDSYLVRYHLRLVGAIQLTDVNDVSKIIADLGSRKIPQIEGMQTRVDLSGYYHSSPRAVQPQQSLLEPSNVHRNQLSHPEHQLQSNPSWQSLFSDGNAVQTQAETHSVHQQNQYDVDSTTQHEVHQKPQDNMDQPDQQNASPIQEAQFHLQPKEQPAVNPEKARKTQKDLRRQRVVEVNEFLSEQAGQSSSDKYRASDVHASSVRHLVGVAFTNSQINPDRFRYTVLGFRSRLPPIDFVAFRKMMLDHLTKQQRQLYLLEDNILLTKLDISSGDLLPWTGRPGTGYGLAFWQHDADKNELKYYGMVQLRSYHAVTCCLNNLKRFSFEKPSTIQVLEDRSIHAKIKPVIRRS